MNFGQGALLEWAPAFALILARVGAAMALLPGVGEAVAPAIVRIGLALSITILLMPELQPMMPPVPAAGLSLGLMIAVRGDYRALVWLGRPDDRVGAAHRSAVHRLFHWAILGPAARRGTGGAIRRIGQAF